MYRGWPLPDKCPGLKVWRCVEVDGMVSPEPTMSKLLYLLGVREIRRNFVCKGYYNVENGIFYTK